MRAPPVAGRNLGSAHSGEFPVADELRPQPGVQKWLHQAGHLNITVATAEQVAHLNHVQTVRPHPVTDTERAQAVDQVADMPANVTNHRGSHHAADLRRRVSQGAQKGRGRQSRSILRRLSSRNSRPGEHECHLAVQVSCYCLLRNVLGRLERSGVDDGNRVVHAAEQVANIERSAQRVRATGSGHHRVEGQDQGRLRVEQCVDRVRSPAEVRLRCLPTRINVSAHTRYAA